MRDAFIDRLLKLAVANPKIMLLTGDLGFKVFDEYKLQLPRQFLNIGVAEQNLASVATGMALEGHTVFTYSIGNFPTLRCLEQLRNDACYHGANVKTVAVGGGFSYGPLGFSHHSTEDLAILRALPGMMVVAPADLWETEQATEALARIEGCTYLRLDKSNAGRTNRPDEVFELGKARMLRAGDDIAIIGCGGIVQEALAAANQLEKDNGISCRVLSMHTLTPVDSDALISAACQTRGIITVEEHSIVGGLGSAVAECLLEAGFPPKRFIRLGLREGFATAVGDQQYLRDKYGMSARAIIAASKSIMSGRE